MRDGIIRLVDKVTNKHVALFVGFQSRIILVIDSGTWPARFFIRGEAIKVLVDIEVEFFALASLVDLKSTDLLPVPLLELIGTMNHAFIIRP